MMTEAEAKEKRCCGPKGSGYSYNSNRYCRGVECMAWRWRVTGVDDDDNDIHDFGYCGLGGKP